MNGGTSMMKFLRQDGYTLLLTLVLVVLLFLVTATFTVASMNQTKQIEKTDDTLVASSLAEMGAEKFSIVIQELLNEEKENYKDCLITGSLNCSTDFEEVISNYASTQAKDLNNDNQVSSTQQFYVSNHSKAISGSKEIYNVTVRGISNNTSRDIDIVYEIDISNEIQVSDPTEFSTYSSSTLLTPYIKECLEDDSCIDSLDNRFHVSKTEDSFKNHNDFGSIKQIYVMDSLSIGHISKDEGLTEFSIYVKDTLSFDKFFELNSSFLEANKMNLSFNPNKSSINDTTLVFNDFHMALSSSNADGYITNKKLIPITGESKVCIRKSYDESVLKKIFNFNDPEVKFITLAGTYDVDNGTYNSKTSLEKTYKEPGGATLNRVSPEIFNESCSVEILDKQQNYEVMNQDNVIKYDYK